MRIFGPQKSMDQSKGFYIVRTQTSQPVITKKGMGIVMILVALSNVFTYNLSKDKASDFSEAYTAPAPERLYLLEEASLHIPDAGSFAHKVKEVAKKLDIPAEWLMSVMYSESKFNPAAVNHKGSGATGLIQFMVPTVKDLNDKMGTELYMSDIRNMPAVNQMDLVYHYLDGVRQKYGSFMSLTDLYLAILYPRAIGKDYCYTLYAKPSRRYTQNSGLDENGDGRVTVSDIDKRMQRIFPEAYIVKP